MNWLARTRTQNLKRHRTHKTFYAVAKVNGQAVARSLGTDSEAVAKLRLPQKLAQIRAAGSRGRSGNLSLGECREIYLATKRAEKGLKPSALDYRIGTFTGIRLTWPDFEAAPAALVSEDVCRAWWAVAAKRYSPARANGMLQSLKGVLAVAVQAGCLASNPANGLRQVTVTPKGMRMVGFEEVNRLLAYLRKRRSLAFWLCRFLYLFSLRVNTARHLTPAMVNRKAQVFEIPGDLVKNRGAGELVVVPIFPEMAELLDELDRRFGRRRKFVLPIRGCLRTLHAACRALKLPDMNHHSFRHVFTSHALERGVDYRIVAKWRNDADGGAFLLKHYSHVIQGIDRKAATELRFQPDENNKIIALPRAAGKNK